MWLPLLFDFNLQKPSRLDRLNKKKKTKNLVRVFRSGRRKKEFVIGLDNSLLMQVLEERVGSEGKPHAIKTPIGWIASGGSFNEKTSTYVAQRVNAVSCTHEIETFANLKETIRNP